MNEYINEDNSDNSYNGNLYIISTFCFCYIQYQVFNNVNKLTYLSIKQKAYILTFFSSICLFLMSCVSNYYLFKYDFNMNMYRFKQNTTNEIVSVLSTSLFTSFLIMDNILGYLYYHEYMKSLSGYFHHAFFILGNYVVYYSDGYKLLNLFLIDELPTIIFALGNINENYRSNIIFGMLMFFTRIVYHGFLVLLNINYINLIIVAIPSWTIYVYWFKIWCKKFYKEI